jgi:ppGpp synthetase/RelA/SpoT-type nucleotidyltranferase
VLENSDLSEQDALKDAVCALFRSDDPAWPKVYDRRENPMQGYRAVHVVVQVGKIPVEIQIRTALQHEWAEYFEKLGDKFGREIRYGEPVNPARFSVNLDDEVEREEVTGTVVRAVTGMTDLAFRVSKLIARLENVGATKRNSPLFAELESDIKDQIELQARAADKVIGGLREMLP